MHFWSFALAELESPKTTPTLQKRHRPQQQTLSGLTMSATQKMGYFKEALKKIYAEISLKNLGISTIVIVTFTYHVIYDIDFPCPSKAFSAHEKADCYLYLILPTLVILILLLLIDQDFHRLCRARFNGKCSCSYNALCHAVVVHLVQALCVGLIWTVSVFLDGDWWVCCQNDGNKTEIEIACKDKTMWTPEEKATMTPLKNRSWVSAYFCLRSERTLQI